jgi:hypothetical protein
MRDRRSRIPQGLYAAAKGAFDFHQIRDDPSGILKP